MSIAALNEAAAVAPEAAALLITYGPLGVILSWFMWRAEGKLEKIPSELRVLGHRLDGLTRAMLADIISRDTTNGKAKEIAQKMLTEMEGSRTDKPSV